MATTAQNGVAKGTATVKPKVPVKKPVQPVTPKVIPLEDARLKKIVSLQARVDRLTEFQTYVSDYNKITDTLKGVGDFKSAQAKSIRFTLEDLVADKTFETTNSNLIGILVNDLIEKLQQKQSELVDKILTFDI